MMIPDFNNCLLNLSASICEVYGCNAKYNSLSILPIAELKKKKNIVMIVIDGLGYNFVKEFGKDSILDQNLLCPITSVFPPTTAVAVTSILTGVAPQEHALTGWYVYLKELGSVSKILPLIPRYSTLGYFNNESDSNDVYEFKSLIDDFQVDTHFIHLEKYRDDFYQKILRGNSLFHGYNDISELSDIISKSLNDNSENKRFIYSYWNGLDGISHKFGFKSNEALTHFEEIKKEIGKIGEMVNFDDTAVIITADHGFMDVADSNKIRVNDIPGLRDCLVLPLMGEPRTPYCYLRSGKEIKFKEIWKKYLSPFSKLYHIDDLMDLNMFGIKAINPKFFDRVGDYIIIMNEGYVLLDNVMLEREMDLIGYHGGVTENEMLVPLIYLG